jgi:hypothetical protein
VRGSHGLLATPAVKSGFAAGQAISRKAQVLGFENGFVFAGVILLAAVGLCLMLQPSAHHGPKRPIAITE